MKCKLLEVATMSDIKKKVRVPDMLGTLTLEKILSAVCFMAGIAFLVAALMGTWRYFLTMGLCFAIGYMISD